MTDEETLFRKRVGEFAKRAWEQNLFTFTDFLGLGECSTLLSMEKELNYAGITLFGGIDGCERVMARFGSVQNAGWEEPFPIVAIKAEPLMQKYADVLTHRDILGALMNLGIKRQVTGDIYFKDNIAYFFCTEAMAPVIAKELVKAKHTNLKCSIIDTVPQDVGGEVQEDMLQIASQRLDVLIAGVFKLSREESLEFFRQKKVFCDGRLMENNSAQAKENSIISVRGMGRFRYLGQVSFSRKGKQNVKIERYQ